MAKSLFLGELFSFTRIETCFFVTGISVAGYAIFNRIDPGILFLSLAMLLGTGASYGHNHLTDREEDVVNNRKVNALAANGRAGKAVVLSLYASGFFFSLFLSLPSIAVYSALISMSAAYSGLRIKRMFILKNVFTGLSMALAFQVGSLVSHAPDAEVVSYMPFVFLFGLTLNILGDIRGLEGDRPAGVRTIPVVMGMDAARKTVYAICAVFLVAVAAFRFYLLLPLAPFMVMISFFLWKGDHRKSRISIICSFIAFSAFMLFLNLTGGI